MIEPSNFPSLLWLLVAVLVLLVLAIILLIVLLTRKTPDPEPGLRMLAQQLAAQIGHQQQSARDAADAARENRHELVGSVQDLGRGLGHQVNRLQETVERQLNMQRQENNERLEAMRQTVDERLQVTLEQKLGDSFRLVSERLEQVQRGLGEMQHLAGDVGDLKRVLTNVKTRGIWGEAQLAAALEQLFAPAQYGVNVEVVPGSGERVDFALKLPGSRQHPLWLPIDAKFPREDYERLLLAQDANDPAAAETAARKLETRLRQEARSISTKYVVPPHSTDFGLLYLPVEGLFAEMARRPGLFDGLQNDYRIIIAGPTTLAAMLSSLQMGLRTLAVEQRSGEIRRLLSTVRTEFSQFGDMLARTRAQLEKAAGNIGDAESRSRAITRRLDDVESLPPHGSDADSEAGDSSLLPGTEKPTS